MQKAAAKRKYIRELNRKNSPYYVDQYGNILEKAPDGGVYVEVLYDSRWDHPVDKAANVEGNQYININNIILKGKAGGHYSNSSYNSRMSVGMTVYFTSGSTYINRVSSPDILSFHAAVLGGCCNNVRANSYASGGRAYATGYVTYASPYVETLSGTASWEF